MQVSRPKDIEVIAANSYLRPQILQRMKLTALLSKFFTCYEQETVFNTCVT